MLRSQLIKRGPRTSPTSRTASPRAVAGAFPAGRVAGGVFTRGDL